MPTGKLGIGHTRWATHGKPTYVNAHPHTDCHHRIFVVHNGIIENFAELKAELQAAGHEFTSDTDTEVVPHLIEANYKGDFLAAVRAALKRIHGAYALAMFSTDDPELLIGARLNAPLVVGLGDGEYYIASDITAIIPYTKRVLVLGEGEVAAVTPLGAQVSTLDGVTVEPKLIHVDWDLSQAQKGGYPHFMLKEIHESSEAVANAMRGRLTDDGIVSFREFDVDDEKLRDYKEVLLLGMGTSRHAAMVGEYLIEDWAGIPARSQDASEFRYRRPTFGPKTLAVVLTQSGETADTLVGLHRAKERGALTVAVTNVVASSAARDADGAIYLHSGPEIGVASTKTLAAHMVSLSPAQPPPGHRQRSRLPRAEARAGGRAEGAPRTGPRAGGPRARDREDRAQVQPVPQLHVLRPRPQLPGGPRGRLEAEGDLVHPRRGHHRRRAEARTHRDARQGLPGHRHLHRQRDQGQDGQQRPRDRGARRPGARPRDGR